MKKTLSEEYSFLNFIKYLIIFSVVIGTLFLFTIIDEQFSIYHIILYISFLVTSVSSIMVINFLFKLDKTKNNLEGKKTTYYENGQKESELTFKDGKEDGLSTQWYENGQKKDEETFKDGKEDGLNTRWYENGQKSFEGTYKNGKFISGKYWNEDGSVKE